MVAVPFEPVAPLGAVMCHYDSDNAADDARAFCFAVMVNDPHAVCGTEGIDYELADLEDLACLPASARSYLIELSTWSPMP